MLRFTAIILIATFGSVANAAAETGSRPQVLSTQRGIGDPQRDGHLQRDRDGLALIKAAEDVRRHLQAAENPSKVVRHVLRGRDAAGALEADERVPVRAEEPVTLGGREAVLSFAVAVDGPRDEPRPPPVPVDAVTVIQAVVNVDNHDRNARH